MEIAFESLSLALENPRGTAATAPTHYLGLGGTLTPVKEFYRPVESRGTLEEYYRSVETRISGTWNAEGGLDTDVLPLFLEMIARGGVTPTTPSGATLARLWDYAPNNVTDTIKSATIWFGDPNVQIWQGKFGVLDTLTISADSTGSDGAIMTLAGTTNFPVRVATPTYPAQTIGSLIMPRFQLWLDTGASAIGTTPVTGRLLSASVSIPLNASKKYAGSEDGNYTRIGRGKRHITTTLRFEIPDMAEYAHYEQGTPVKARVRFLGPLIETGFTKFVEVDTYGPFDGFTWGEYENTNRTMEVKIESQVDQTTGASWAMRVQNTRTAL